MMTNDISSYDGLTKDKMLIKTANSSISFDDIKTAAAELDDPEILAVFKKTAADLRAIAPKAKDFLYFTCTMMHAAEAVAKDESGEIRKLADGTPVSVGWKVNDKGAWIWETNDPNILPYKNANCFVPGTKISMSDGSVKNIEDVVIGDYVITHNQKSQKVIALSKTDHDGEVFTIKTSNNIDVTSTGNHPFYIIKNNSNDSLFNRVIKDKKYSYEYVDAQDLKVGDYTVSPMLDEVVNSEITEDSARLLGLYAAEGSINNNRVIFSFGLHEKNTLGKNTLDLVNKTFASAKCSTKEDIKANKFSVYVGSKEFTSLCDKHVGKLSHGKKLSKEIVFAPEQIKKAFLNGWLDGDGGTDKYSGRVCGTTVSKHLAYQTRLMLNSIKINNSLYERNPVSSVLKDGRKIVGKHNVFRVRIPYNSAKRILNKDGRLNRDLNVKNVERLAFTDDYRIHKILKINKSHYKGPVYNFEVENDHTYVANNLIVHNCDIFPREELKKAYKKWIGKPLCLDHQSSSVDKIRGIIVDTVYDDKYDRVIALCALDKTNYPDLARQVTAGYAKDVSMGTAVSKAICTEKGCHRIASVESEFCDHMKRKSGYGEINVGLSPIELSIVVNGADPKAKIRRVIAEAGHIAQYVENNNLNEKEITELKIKIASIKKEVDELKASDNNSSDKTDNDENEADTMTRSTKDLKDESETSELPGIGIPARDRFASEDYQSLLKDLNVKLSHISEVMNKLVTKEGNVNTKGNEMVNKKEAYFQGGGGVNEPTPGKPRYEVEPYAHIRDTQDKQMVGKSPFPETGSTEDLFPGDKEVKEKLLRASLEERKLRRRAAVENAKNELEQKRAYFLGGGGVNDPENLPYPKDPLNEKARDKEDKQMVGKAPFPNTGKVDELYPGDKAKKEMVARAKLVAKFVKASKSDGADDLAASRWDVYAKSNDSTRLIFSATVADIAGLNKVAALYDLIKTEDYAKKIMSTIKNAGVDTATSIFKTAQAAPVAPGAMPAMPADAGGAAPMPAMPSEVGGVEEAMGSEYDGGEGTPVEVLKGKINELENLVAELQKAVKALEEEDTTDLDETPLAMPEETGVKTAGVSPVKIRKVLHAGLVKGSKEAISKLASSVEELGLLKEVYAQGKVNAMTKEIEKQAFAEASANISNAYSTMETFVNYAKGTDKLKKKAESMLDDADADESWASDEDDIRDENGDETEVDSVVDMTWADDNEADIDYKSVPDPRKNPGQRAPQGPHAQLPMKGKPTSGPAPRGSRVGNPGSQVTPQVGRGNTSHITKEVADAAARAVQPAGSAQVKKPQTAPSGDPLEGIDMKGDKNHVVDKKEVTELAAKEVANKVLNAAERRALRLKLAQKGVTFSDMLGKAHPQGSAKIKDVNSNDAVVEDLEDVHSAMMDLANAPVKVRKDAEVINKLVLAGKINPATDFPGLIANGLDTSAVAYWKKFFGQVDGGSGYAAELVKDYQTKKAAEELDGLKVKLARAYDLAYQMADKGLISKTAEAIKEQVSSLTKCSDEQFVEYKGLVKKFAINKTAGIPSVGVEESLMGVSEVRLPSIEGKSSDLKSELSGLWVGSKPRR